MKINNHLFLLFVLFSISNINAQESFFSALKKQENKRYTSYYNIYEDGGKIFASTYHKTHRAMPLEYEGIPTGIQFFDKEKGEDKEKERGKKIEFTSPGSYRLAGYPNTRMLHFVRGNTGIVVIGNYIFELKGVNEDATNFRKIDHMYLANLDNNGKKIKGISKKTAMADNPYKLVRDYLVAMKKIEDEYTLTKSDEADLALMNLAQEAYEKKVQGDFEEFKKIKAEQKRLMSGTIVTLKNTSSEKIWIGSESTHISPDFVLSGSTIEWDCDDDAYIYQKSSSGDFHSKRKVYSANSGCGKTISIN
ncbi:hypothetical protein [Aureispira anguillae]|uniref:Uncharacterized protein n=1 Tax=Aureispira anguillae TaxID=2864201 RepID=A0A915YCS9_9BACT|nr:hypothetical protein [Aureispira anguillae]BDS10698.1 hypothetical protein AsAng_0014070 [Aureispira anguillae]